MGVEVRPFGVKCNIQCTYCYQNPERDAGNILRGYDVDRMKAAIEAEQTDGFHLFGGEPLMMPEDDLEEMWRWGLEKFGKNMIQTNGTLINDRHIEMFRRYKVGVGMSLDGPGELNDARWHIDLETTRDMTRRSLEAIVRLCESGWPPALIVTLHRLNAVDERLERLMEWLVEMEDTGVRSIRLHILEVEDEHVGRALMLTKQENLTAFARLAELAATRLRRIRFVELDDMTRLLTGRDNNTTCVWNACDPYTTRSVRGIEGNGQRSNCGRTNKDGIGFAKADVEGFERYLALYHTPMQHDGCSGCRFFLVCKGQCPGTSVDTDWRNRTADCSVWFGLYEQLEQLALSRGETPISVSPHRRAVERRFLDAWAEGRNTLMENEIAMLGLADLGAPCLEEIETGARP